MNEILKMFTSEYREDLKCPMLVKDKCFASNTFCAIVAPSTWNDGYNVASNDFFEKAVNDSEVINCSEIINKELLRSILKELPRIPEYISKKCIECNGDGYSVCSCCNQDVECGKCNGEGFIKTPSKIFTDVIEDRIYISVNDIIFNAVYLEILLGVSDEVKSNITMTLKAEDGMNVFSVGELKVIIMPVKKSEDLVIKKEI